MSDVPDDPVSELELADGSKLRARGVPITLEFPVDDLGEQMVLAQLQVRFDYGAVEQLEVDFGSLDGFIELLGKGEKGPMMRTLRLALQAGLSHQHEVSPEQIRSALRLEDVVTYIEVVTKAWEQAQPGLVNGKRRGEARAAVSGSRGRGSTTSRRSSSGARKRPSGA